ncbi:hypothetical protein GC207_10300 [bacterium]|nr:hypothetical protein [bacterium]
MPVTELAQVGLKIDDIFLVAVVGTSNDHAVGSQGSLGTVGTFFMGHVFLLLVRQRELLRRAAP